MKPYIPSYKDFFGAATILPLVAMLGVGASTAFTPLPDCPPKLEIGQNYHAIQSGPCPDIDSVASFKAADSVHVGYRCRSQNVMVVGDMRTGRMDAFFLYVPE